MGFRDERGMMAIGVALMLIVVLPLFGGVLWQYSMAEMKRAQKTNDDLQALYLARAGAELAMGALKGELDSTKRPFGQLDPIYFDLEKNEFTSVKPVDFLGEIVVRIELEPASEEEDEENEVTVIYATATVGVAERTVKMVTYPHRYGHELGWYEQGTGKIIHSDGKAPADLVIMRTNPETKPIHLASGTVAIGNSRIFTANTLVFESPLKLASNVDTVKDSSTEKYEVVFLAERVFLDEIEIAFLSKHKGVSFDYAEKNFPISFILPQNGEKSLSGSEIRKRVSTEYSGYIKGDDDKYGEIYFDKPITYKNYRWKGSWWDIAELFFSIQSNQDYSLNVAGQGFYFKDGFVLDGKRIQEEYLDKKLTVNHYFGDLAEEGWLLPIAPGYQVERKHLEDLRPFFWEE